MVILGLLQIASGAGSIIKKGIRCEEIIDKMEDVWLVK